MTVFDPPKHKNILIRILKDIYTDAALAPRLGFKGGTAAYLFYNLERLSLDLDFDLLEETEIEAVFEKIKATVSQYGTIRQHRIKRYNLFLLLSYQAGAPNIKIEINRRRFGSRYEVKTYLGISMQVMVHEDMFAHKLVAMYERLNKANRDIFDVWFFFKNDWPINQEIVEKRTELSFQEFLKQCCIELEQMPDRGILSGMGELLSENQKSWVKQNLKKDLIFQLKLKQENLS